MIGLLVACPILAKWVSAVAGSLRKRSAIQPAVNWLFGAVVLLAGQRRVARDAIGGLGVAVIEQLAGDQPPLDPPLVAVDRLAVIVRHRQHQLGGFGRSCRRGAGTGCG